jgi:hypothetical protein
MVEAQLVAVVEGRGVLGEDAAQADDALVRRLHADLGERVAHQGAVGQLQLDLFAAGRQVAPHLAKEQHAHPHAVLPARILADDAQRSTAGARGPLGGGQVAAALRCGSLRLDRLALAMCYKAAMDESNLRVGDVERQEAADALQHHYVAGRLSTEELAERVRQATAARTRAELNAVLRDLPPQFAPNTTQSPPAPDTPTPAPPRSGVPRDVRTNATAFGLTMLLLVVIWLITTPGGYFWPIWPMLGWGFAVAMHAFARRT